MFCASVAQMKSIDRRAITQYGIPGVVLMENAGRGVVTVIEKSFAVVDRGAEVLVVCGVGNNGGDGMVVCRHLLRRGASPRCFLVGKKSRMKGDAKTNLHILEKCGIDVVEMEDRIPRQFTRSLGRSVLVVDALFGTGFRGKLKGCALEVVERINRSRLPVVSIDCPSGLNVDTGCVDGSCVEATATVTMCVPKVGLVFYPGRRWVGELWVVDIGVAEQAIAEEGILTTLLESHDIHMPPRDPAGHKTTFGWVAIVAGSAGLTGAGAMASLACLRCGAGMATLCLPESLNAALEAKLTEVMTYPLPETDAKTLSLDALESMAPVLKKADVVALGPGLSTHPETEQLVRSLIEKVDLPMVVDADGLNALSGKLRILRRRKAATILTPHPGEMARLTKMGVPEIMANKPEVAARFAGENRVTTVLKGAPTIIASPKGEVFINSTGSSALATAGSGDVLTGLIAGLLAQGLSSTDAAATGVFLHGLAGDIMAERRTEYGVIATDLLESIPEAIELVLGSERSFFEGGVRRVL